MRLVTFCNCVAPTPSMDFFQVEHEDHMSESFSHMNWPPQSQCIILVLLLLLMLQVASSLKMYFVVSYFTDLTGWQPATVVNIFQC